MPLCSHISKTTRPHCVKFYVHVDCGSFLLWSNCDLRYIMYFQFCGWHHVFTQWCVLLHIMHIPKRRQHNGLKYYIDSKQILILLNYKNRLWCCWLGGRKGIWPVKNWLVGCWHGYPSGARCIFAYGPADATAISWFSKIQIGFYLSSTDWSG